MSESPLRQRWHSFKELLSSMRFAIALADGHLHCLGDWHGHHSSINRVNNYVNQFGPFWAELFLALKLNAVYSAWWFLLILAFLVTSTTLCLLRHTPKYPGRPAQSTRKTFASKACRPLATRPRPC